MKTILNTSLLSLAILASGCVSPEVQQKAAELQSEIAIAAEQQRLKFETARPILIIGHNAEWPNSADGVSVTLTFQNRSGKVIKYATFTVTPINRVGDVVASDVGGHRTKDLLATGPFDENFTSAGFLIWENVWYNNTITFARLDKVEIEYMDGTKEVVAGDALAAIQVRPENNVFASGVQQSRRLTIDRGAQLSLSRK